MLKLTINYQELEMQENNSVSKGTILKFAGAFMAWVIGSGFATGQEILQFFSSFGYYSFIEILINLAGFLLIGTLILKNGYDHRGVENFNHFKYYCGNILGTFYSWAIPITLILSMSVLISGAGATLSEYYGVNHYVGAAIMAAMVLAAYLAGFDNLVKVVSLIAPAIIGFSLFVGIFTICRDHGNFDKIGSYAPVLSKSQNSPFWLLSGILYIPLQFIGGSKYFTALGASAPDRRVAKWGAIIGSLGLIISVLVVSTAIMLNGNNAAALAIPTLFLATKISFILGGFFSVCLILGIFSSCAAMMWTVCDFFTSVGVKHKKPFAVGVAAFTFFLGLFSFSGLISVFYPLIGYLGLIFVGCVIWKGLKH
jgi:uncharacterized membrane protein YkvI